MVLIQSVLLGVPLMASWTELACGTKSKTTKLGKQGFTRMIRCTLTTSETVCLVIHKLRENLRLVDSSYTGVIFTAGRITGHHTLTRALFIF